MNNGLSKSEAKKQVGSIWSYLAKDEDKDKLVEEFEAFKTKMNETGKSAKDLAKEMGNDLSPEIRSYVKTSKDGKLSTEGFNSSIGNLSIGAKAANVAMKGLALAGNIFLSWLASEALSVLYDFITSSDRMAEKAQELGSSFKTSESDISDYKDKIQELNDKINDSTTPYDEVVQARKDLMSIQDEMIQKYGDEEGAITNITNAINGQTSAFDNLTNQQYQKMVNDFNKNDKIADKVKSFFVGSNFDQMLAKEKNYSEEIAVSQNDKLNEYIKKLGGKEQFDANGMSTGYYALTGSLDEVYQSLLNIQTVSEQLGEDKYAQKLSDQINDAKELTDQYSDMYNSYLLYDNIFNNTDYTQSYKDAIDAYKEYQTMAENNGFNSEEAQKASDEYTKIISDAMDNAFKNGDDGVANYFESMYPDLQAVVDQWRFKAKITPEWDDGSKNDSYDKETDTEMKEALSHFSNAEEIKNFNSKTATTAQQNAMNQLQQIAHDNFSNDINALVDAAVSLYGLETQGEQDFINRIGGKSSKNKTNATAGASKTLANSTDNNKVDSKTASEWYNSLSSDEDKAIANSDEFVKALKQQKTGLEDGKYSAENYANALKEVQDAQAGVNSENTSASISDLITNLDALQTNMKDLDSIMADFISGDGIDVSNLSGIVDSFKELQEAGKDIDMTSVESAIQQISDASSLEEAQSALDSLCTQYVYASGVLDDLTDSNKALVEQRLKAIGVANAEEVVEQQLEAQKLATKVATEGLTEATLSEIQEMMDEKGYSEQAQQALYQLLLTKIDIANNPINTASDIEQLIALAEAAGTASNYVEKLQRILNMMNGINTYTKSYNNTNDAKQQQRDEQAFYRSGASTVDEYAIQQANQLAKLMQTSVSKTKLNASDFIKTPKYGGGSSTKSAQNKANKSSGGSGSGNNSSSEPQEQDYDWIETLISRIQRKVTNLGKTVSATYKSWSTRNNALAQELSAVNEQISAEQGAYNKYMQLANSVGLSENYASLVRNGALDVSSIADDDLNEKIKLYKQYYENALSAADAIQDLQDKVAELAKTKFDNINSEYEAQLKQIDHSINMYDKMIDTAETQGYIASQKYYNTLISTESSNISKLQSQYSSLISARNEAMKSGNIAEYSEEWYNMTDSINSVEEAIQDANKALIEYKNNLRQVNWDFFDKQEDYVSKLQDESDWLIDLITTENKLYDSDTGKKTDSAKAVEGLHAVNYNAYMTQADDYAEEIKKIDAEIANDPANTTLIERRQELLEQQRDMIKSAEDEKSAIKDLVSDGYDALSEALKKIADDYLDALNAQKDLYDYAKTIREQTKAIAQYEKQLEAIKNDTSEEMKSQIQQIKVKLEDAKQDLEDSEYNQWISDQQQIVQNFED